MKYNWSIIGHEKQLELLENDINFDKLSHAYLLAGPNSVGKHTVARKLAGILQCEKDFCHKCPTCQQISSGSHLDTVELRDEGDSIKIEDVRKLVERCNMTGQSRYKIFLIQGVERMTTEAANSFLKTLEEPPERTVFVLTTNNIRALLPTIVSRVRVVNFQHVSTKYLESKLKDLYSDREDKEIRQVSLFSLGKTGKAIHLMENPASLAKYFEVYRDVQNFLDRKSVVDRFSYVEEIAEDKKQTELFLNILMHVLRSRVLEGKEVDRYLNTLSKIEETGILLKKNINTRLALENLMLII
ncbi:DNA polymerase III subunit [Candidatus Peregrinibacteria bacterium]|jgi:DNA polymerase III subunit delta'|nr:DNA polymerase III subunit [Candidatus Peregrinibacteria bacterium]MBT7736564.1 DNA polymerase III subunit [Candidatus Peregrinibacteria bacterium]